MQGTGMLARRRLGSTEKGERSMLTKVQKSSPFYIGEDELGHTYLISKGEYEIFLDNQEAKQFRDADGKQLMVEIEARTHNRLMESYKIAKTSYQMFCLITILQIFAFFMALSPVPVLACFFCGLTFIVSYCNSNEPKI